MLDMSKLPKEVQDKMEMKANSDASFENALSEDYSEIFFNKLKECKNPMDQKSFIADFYGLQGSGKSYGSLSTCGFLDKKFNIDRIFFDIELLVNARKDLRPHTAVLVDEMTTAFGIDSNRVNIMLSAIKEQLRKKSIHMCYASPTLKNYQNSIYVLESMFIDKKEKMSYFAYKTNELMTLGYVKIPHPLNYVDKQLMIDYEDKKDEHLNKLLEGGADSVQDRAVEIMKNEMFLKAEQVYIQARGYIPYKILVQLVEKVYPEFKGSVIVYELADRIKCEREISSVWKIFTSGKNS